ncbi:MAG: alpha/beta hydrolase family protein [Phycisphaerales bacterium]
MIPRFSQLPTSLASIARTVRLGRAQIPALLIHPDWTSSRPTALWFHGRTAYKELDAGRYQRWVRAGIAACAIDLPGHGERADASLQESGATLRVVDQAVNEIDEVISDLGRDEFKGIFDVRRLGIGGMSAGGIVALRRLCDPHPFAAAAVEGTTGSFDVLPHYRDRHGDELVQRLDPIRHLDRWRPIPLLALHSERDAWVPVSGIQQFVAQLGQHYADEGASRELIRLYTWAETGAPYEHLGFGRMSNEAKNLQTSFLAEHLLPPRV